MSETTFWNGKKYRRYPDSEHLSDRMYFKRSSGGKGYLLHRDVWKHENGPIPDGHEIHHRDEDPGNNSPSNLVCLTPAEHKAQHPFDADRLERQRQHLERIRPLTKAWHSSEEGTKKHREIGALAYKNFVPIPKPCDQCGNVFSPGSTGNRDRFCSNACKSAHRRDKGFDDVERRCLWCGETFTANKYRKTKTCSRSCTNRQRARDKRERLRSDG